MESGPIFDAMVQSQSALFLLHSCDVRLGSITKSLKSLFDERAIGSWLRLLIQKNPNRCRLGFFCSITPPQSDNVKIRVSEINFSRQLDELMCAGATCAVGIVIQCARIFVVYYAIGGIMRLSTDVEGG